MAKEKSKESRVVRVYLYENNMEELKGTYYARLAHEKTLSAGNVCNIVHERGGASGTRNVTRNSVFLTVLNGSPTPVIYTRRSNIRAAMPHGRSPSSGTGQAPCGTRPKRAGNSPPGRASKTGLPSLPCGNAAKPGI